MMDCPECGAATVGFAVPEDLRDLAPGPSAAICTECLRTFPAEDGDVAPDFQAVSDAFPTGRAGVATALLLGRLDALALNREDVAALVEAAETAGADVWLVLDRLDDGRDAHFDLERRRVQIEEFV